MAIILFDNAYRHQLFPFTYTRAIAGLRFGIFTVKERWERLTGKTAYVYTENYLQALYPLPPEGEHVWIDASVMDDITGIIQTLDSGQSIADDKGMIAGKTSIPFHQFNPSHPLTHFNQVQQVSAVKRLDYPWQMSQWNDAAIRQDFALITKDRKSQSIPATVNTIAPENIFIEEGAKLNYCTLNASAGPIYIGKSAEIMEGSAIRGPFVLGEDSVVKMNSRIYGATSLGPRCLGGGEIKNSVLMGYSNKIHDGYIGDSVIGEWCNIGSGTSNSNIKNTAGEIFMQLMQPGEKVSAGFKCGVMMGDYTRTAINSSINTGTIIGIASNVSGAGFLPRLIPNFSWGVDGTRYEIEKAIRDISNWKKMKDGDISIEERTMLEYIFASQ